MNYILSTITLTLCFFHSLSAKIIEIDSFQDSLQEIQSLDKNSLVLFDVDNTLIIMADGLLGPHGERYRQGAIQRLSSISTLSSNSYKEGYLYSQVLIKAKWIVVEDQSRQLVNSLLSKGIPTIAFTAADSGKMGYIESMADWRISQLAELGFDFSSSFSDSNFLLFPKKIQFEHFPMFKSGVLFSSDHTKGHVIKQFLSAIPLTPSKVVFFDDKLSYLKSVERAMDKLGITFIGYHYLAAEKLPNNFDKQLAIFQIKQLIEHGEWLNDHEAIELMQKM
jgi:hypothetical protein